MQVTAMSLAETPLEVKTASAVKTVELIPLLNEDEAEVGRQMQICNACRYCEGFCAVFPAMTRRLEFNKADIHYLANLCHNCGACLHSCQYAPPHEFGVNVPQAMAKVRLDTYSEYAWPAAFGRLYKRNGVTLSVATATGLALFLILTIVLQGDLFPTGLNGNFYALFPHNTLALMFGSVFGFALLSLGIGVRHFWKNISPDNGYSRSAQAAARDTSEAVLGSRRASE
jgi:citrate/tricarballylate utilization protein